MKFDYKNKHYSLSNPALLVGNGVNKYLPTGQTESVQNELSWKELLSKLLPSEFVNGNSPVLDDLTYPEMAELAKIKREEQLPSINENSKKKKESLKTKILSEILEYEAAVENIGEYYGQKRVSEFSEKHSIPVLTTNFDHTLLWYNRDNRRKSKPEDLFFVSQSGKIKKKTEKGAPPHLFNALYAKNLTYNESFVTDVRKFPGIWFIHGSERYPSSFCITNDDYAKNIQQIRNKISFRQIKNQIEWDGKNTWLNIFMTNDLVIMGLGLDLNELDLRWLLVQRHRYQEYIHKNGSLKANTIYLYTSDEEMKFGKNTFFNAIGINCIKMGYDDIYSFSAFSI